MLDSSVATYLLHEADLKRLT